MLYYEMTGPRITRDYPTKATAKTLALIAVGPHGRLVLTSTPGSPFETGSEADRQDALDAVELPDDPGVYAVEATWVSTINLMRSAELYDYETPEITDQDFHRVEDIDLAMSKVDCSELNITRSR